jgi:hypothetical protein
VLEMTTGRGADGEARVAYYRIVLEMKDRT